MDFGNKEVSSNDLQNTEHTEKNINNHMVKSAIATFLIAPAGVVALVYSFFVDMNLDKGNMTLAQKYSKRANNWGNTVIFIAVMFIILAFLLGATSYIAEYMM